MTQPPTSQQAIIKPSRGIARDGYVVLAAHAAQDVLRENGCSAQDWQRFAQSWQRMPMDRYMADGGRYRRRRHAVFAVTADGTATPQPRQPHYQSRDYNPLNGGIQRWFAPVETEVMDNPVLHALMRLCARVFGQLASDVERWHVELHQFRVEAKADMPAQPTPEGVHRDGVDFVLVLLANRHNVASGTTHIQGPDGSELGSFTLSDAGDCVLLDDHRVLHGVTPIEPLQPGAPAHRDALVITFARPHAADSAT